MLSFSNNFCRAGILKSKLKISRTLYSVKNPITQEANRVVVTNNASQVDAWIEKHVMQANENAVGFDAEWCTGTHPKVSLAQIGVGDSTLLVQLNHMNSKSEMLANLLKSPNIRKVGVAVEADLLRLKDDFGYQYNGFCDIGLTAERLGHFKTSLSYLSTTYLNFSPGKPKSLQMSNWNAYHLTERQVEYAAYDALLSYLVYRQLENKDAYKENNINDFLETNVFPHLNLAKHLIRKHLVKCFEIPEILDASAVRLHNLTVEDYMKPYTHERDALIAFLGRYGYVATFVSSRISVGKERMILLIALVNERVIAYDIGLTKDAAIRNLSLKLIQTLLTVLKNESPVSHLTSLHGKFECLPSIKEFMESAEHYKSWNPPEEYRNLVS